MYTTLNVNEFNFSFIGLALQYVQQCKKKKVPFVITYQYKTISERDLNALNRDIDLVSGAITTFIKLGADKATVNQFIDAFCLRLGLYDYYIRANSDYANAFVKV